MPPHTRSSPRPGPCCKKSPSAGASFGYLTAWAGTSWSLQKVPAPAGAQAGLLASVSCPSAASCVAVGNYLNSSGHHVVLAETWNGTAWAIRPAAVPPGASRSYLNGVSCLSPGSCTAVGNHQSGRHAHLTLAERWNGTSWAIQANPNPNALRAGLSAVSWLSASFCTAVGTQTSRWQNQTPLAQAWNGTARSIQQTPAPASSTLSLLSGVACPTATDCFSAGQGGGNAGSAALIQHWSGSSWSIQRTPVTLGFDGSVGGISCTSATACTTVGETSSRHGGRTLAERWNGTSWCPGLSPRPALTASTTLGASPGRQRLSASHLQGRPGHAVWSGCHPAM